MNNNTISPKSKLPPVTSFLVKVASRCNLACDYCYMYEHADQSWRQQPHVMSVETIDRLVRRIDSYVSATGIANITVVLHGGEPLLAGKKVVEYLVHSLRTGVSGHCKVEISVQTNATLLTPSWLDLFARWDVTVSVSLDGTKAANDRHRLTATGASSYDSVARGIEHLNSHPQWAELFTGILAVVDLENDPNETYESLAGFVDSFDFLLPDGSYERLPPRLITPGIIDGEALYGKWLARVFDRWYAAEDGIKIRLFENIMDLCLGGVSRTEGIGLGVFSILTIETNGEIQDVDVLKVSYSNAPKLGNGYSVYDHDFLDVLASPSVVERIRLTGESGLCSTCKECSLMQICGGGHLPHRYRQKNGFDNPSIYCGDLAYLIQHIQRRITLDLKAAR